MPIERANELTGLSGRQLRAAVRKGLLAVYRPGAFERARLYFAPDDLAKFNAASRVDPSSL
jgi:hypothetical protein